MQNWRIRIHPAFYHAPDVTMLLTRGRNDFDYPSIHQELSAYSVELHFSAGNCNKRLRELERCNL